MKLASDSKCSTDYGHNARCHTAKRHRRLKAGHGSYPDDSQIIVTREVDSWGLKVTQYCLMLRRMYDNVRECRPRYRVVPNLFWFQQLVRAASNRNRSILSAFSIFNLEAEHKPEKIFQKAVLARPHHHPIDTLRNLDGADALSSGWKTSGGSECRIGQHQILVVLQ